MKNRSEEHAPGRRTLLMKGDKLMVGWGAPTCCRRRTQPFNVSAVGFASRCRGGTLFWSKRKLQSLKISCCSLGIPICPVGSVSSAELKPAAMFAVHELFLLQTENQQLCWSNIYSDLFLDFFATKSTTTYLKMGIWGGAVVVFFSSLLEWLKCQWKWMLHFWTVGGSRTPTEPNKQKRINELHTLKPCRFWLGRSCDIHRVFIHCKKNKKKAKILTTGAGRWRGSGRPTHSCLNSMKKMSLKATR